MKGLGGAILKTAIGIKLLIVLKAAWTVLQFIAVMWLIYCIIRKIIKNKKKK